MKLWVSSSCIAENWCAVYIGHCILYKTIWWVHSVFSVLNVNTVEKKAKLLVMWLHMKFQIKTKSKVNIYLYIYLADTGEARGCSTNTFVTDWLIHPLVKIFVRRRHAQTVQNGASSHKTYYIDIFSEILNIKGHLNSVMVQKLWRFCSMGWFCLLVELHQERSALQPA